MKHTTSHLIILGILLIIAAVGIAASTLGGL